MIKYIKYSLKSIHLLQLEQEGTQLHIPTLQFTRTFLSLISSHQSMPRHVGLYTYMCTSLITVLNTSDLERLQYAVFQQNLSTQIVRVPRIPTWYLATKQKVPDCNIGRTSGTYCKYANYRTLFQKLTRTDYFTLSSLIHRRYVRMSKLICFKHK